MAGVTRERVVVVAPLTNREKAIVINGVRNYLKATLAADFQVDCDIDSILGAYALSIGVTREDLEEARQLAQPMIFAMAKLTPR